MKRVEIIFSQSLKEDILDSLKNIPEAKFYTCIPNVTGCGYTNPKLGDAVWPDTNEMLIIYTDVEEAVTKIEKEIEKIRASYPNEGVAFFVVG